MATYDGPIYETICFPSKDFTSADVPYTVRGPKGRRGKLKDAMFCCTTTCAGATTKPIIKAGISGTLGAYLLWDLGTTAAASGIRASATTGLLVLDTNKQFKIHPSDTDLIVTLVAATGGGAAGIGVTSFMFEWF
jgi:hypothetical protein